MSRDIPPSHLMSSKLNEDSWLDQFFQSSDWLNFENLNMPDLLEFQDLENADIANFNVSLENAERTKFDPLKITDENSFHDLENTAQLQLDLSDVELAPHVDFGEAPSPASLDQISFDILHSIRSDSPEISFEQRPQHQEEPQHELHPLREHSNPEGPIQTPPLFHGPSIVQTPAPPTSFSPWINPSSSTFITITAPTMTTIFTTSSPPNSFPPYAIRSPSNKRQRSSVTCSPTEDLLVRRRQAKCRKTPPSTSEWILNPPISVKPETPATLTAKASSAPHKPEAQPAAATNIQPYTASLSPSPSRSSPSASSSSASYDALRQQTPHPTLSALQPRPVAPVFGCFGLLRFVASLTAAPVLDSGLGSGAVMGPRSVSGSVEGDGLKRKREAMGSEGAWRNGKGQGMADQGPRAEEKLVGEWRGGEVKMAGAWRKLRDPVYVVATPAKSTD